MTVKVKIMKCSLCDSKIFSESSRTININGKEETILNDCYLGNSFKINDKLICHRCLSIIRTVEFDYSITDKVEKLAQLFIEEYGNIKIISALVDDFILRHHKDLGTTIDLSYPLLGRLKHYEVLFFNKAKVIEVKKNESKNLDA